MYEYDRLLNLADTEGISVVEKNFKSNLKGLCVGKKIAIEKNMSEAEKRCVLVEELGHYYITVGNIIDYKNSFNTKQEKIARKWAVNKLLKPDDLIRAVKSGCEHLADVAEFLNVTEQFLTEALKVFSDKYGAVYKTNEYIIHFNDNGYFVESINDCGL